MKHKWWLVCIALCAVLSTGIGYCIAGKMQQTNAEEQYFPIGDITIYNLIVTGNGVVCGEDPQLVLPQLNTYIETIRLEGIKESEELQIFYSTGGQTFSEENSFFVVPKPSDGGVEFSIEKDIVSLRIDFTGAAGSIYPLEGITVFMQGSSVWGLGAFLVSLLVGVTLGLCITVVLAERKNLNAYLIAFKKYRYLLEDMVVRDIKLKYRRSVIGLLWSVLNPLLMMCVITAVFRNLFRFTIDNFAVYYLTGWVVFNFVTEATTNAMGSILGSGILIRKVYVPKYIFPVQKCMFAFVNMFFSLAALLVVMLVLHIPFTWKLLLIPIPLILALVFSIGVGMILATAAVFFRDIIHLYTVFTMVWMYLTPIIYPMDILSDTVLTIVKANPMYYYVDCFRQLTLYGTLPNLAEIGMMILWSIISLVLGVVVFKKKQDRFILFI